MGNPKTRDWSYNPILFYKNLEYEWYPLDGYPNIASGYMINKDGMVFSTLSNKILSHDINHAGYHRVSIYSKDKKKIHLSVHRLVAFAFIINPFPESFNDVNHRNGNKDINCYWNLEWCNNNMNKHHAAINNLYQYGENRYNSIYSDNLIHEICSKFQSGMSYNDVCDYYKSNPFTQPYEKVRDLIYKLYHRVSRRHITSQYKY